MRNQLQRLGRNLSTVAVVALVIIVAAPDVSAQSRGRTSDQESRTSGRSATVNKSSSRTTTTSASKVKTADPVTKATRNTSAGRNEATARGATSGTVDSRSSGVRTNDTANATRNSRTTTRGDRAVRTNGNRGDRTVDRDRQDNKRRVDNRRKKVTTPRVRKAPRVVAPNRYYRYNTRYKRYVHTSSHVYLGVTWPWAVRYRTNWRPRYVYRQVVYVNAGWRGGSRAERVDVSTSYSQRIIEANADYAEVEITIENIDIAQDGYHLGFVDRIPNRVGKIRATIWSDGVIEFDKNVFVIGDRVRGFEIIATQNYDDYLLNAYRNDDRLDVARIDLNRNRATMASRSRLFNPHTVNGNVPISLLPDDDRLWDYRNSALSGVDDSRYRSRDLSIQYSTNNGLDVELRGETYLDRIN